MKVYIPLDLSKLSRAVKRYSSALSSSPITGISRAHNEHCVHMAKLRFEFDGIFRIYQLLPCLDSFFPIF